jgi:hypothetical protein
MARRNTNDMSWMNQGQYKTQTMRRMLIMQSAGVFGQIAAMAIFKKMKGSQGQISGDGDSVVRQNVKRGNLLDSEAYFAIETDTATITAGNYSRVQAVSDLSAKVLSDITTNDDTKVKWSWYRDAFTMISDKPFVAVPFIIIAEPGSTFGANTNTDLDPRTSIMNALSSSEFKLRIENEIMAKLHADGNFVGSFEVELVDVVNRLMDLHEEAQFSGDTLPKIWLGLWFNATPETTITFHQVSRRQQFTVVNKF